MAVKALEGCERCHQQVTARYNLGLYLQRLDELDAAEREFDAGAQLANEFLQPRLRVRGLFEKGRLTLRRGAVDSARAQLRRARAEALEHGLRPLQFHCAFYLWKIARQSGDVADSHDLIQELKSLRLLLDQRSEELAELDQFLALRRAEMRSRRP